VTRILTVDDSRAVRMLIKKALADMDFEISEAENGELGLAAVEQNSPQLILLDVTMPVLDGPGMLERLRAKGNSTPVLLLTAESGTGVIGPMLKQGGVCDYIVKPFKPEQLRAKVIEALQRRGTLPNATSAEGGGLAVPGKASVDVLLIDDMDNVAKKLRTMLPERLTFNSCVDPGTALHMCRESVYRAVILDTDIPDVDGPALLRDLRILQPTAAFVALLMRSNKNPTGTATELGFAAHLVKPFDVAQVDEFVDNYFGNRSLLTVDDNVITPAAPKGAAGSSDTFYRRLQQMATDAASQAAAACHDRLIVNASQITPSPALAKFFLRLRTQCTDVGIELRVVGGPDVVKLLKQLVETADIPVADSVEAAKAA
jgi:two-component system, cell cycle response regulator